MKSAGSIYFLIFRKLATRKKRNWRTVLRIVFKYCFSKVHFTEDKSRMNYKGIHFTSLNTLFYKFTSICLLSFNLFQIYFKFVHICFKFVLDLFRNSLQISKAQRKTLLPRSLFIKFTGLQSVTLSKKEITELVLINFSKFLIRFKFQKQLLADVLQNSVLKNFAEFNGKPVSREFWGISGDYQGIWG